MPRPHLTSILVVKAGLRRCALRISDVIETMRPLPTEPVRESPIFIRGLSIIRGAPVPVVDLAMLLGDSAPAEVFRFVSMRVGKRRLALALREVLGLRTLEDSLLEGMPPLLCEKNSMLDAVGVLDSEFVLLLGTARIIPDDAWAALEKSGT